MKPGEEKAAERDSLERYVCIHGHFYQPPRENPWLEAVELQDSAYPYHDWNERITAECYGPNAASRILDEKNFIVKLVNNYANISFNCGPTLLSWLEEHARDVYLAILEADALSRERFSGHGSALAQAYNHMILPLANRRDRRTQLLWGVRDFEHRFRRQPEGMWLPETAVDLDTLEDLAELGLRFTILAPHQAKRVRRRGGRAWRDVSGSRIDPTAAYQLALPSGRKIALFFYDGPISRAVAFEGLLSRGENLAHRLIGAFHEERDWYELVHIATDGESYGHHHPFGDMALAYALQYIEERRLARLTNYGEYLERHPPPFEVEIFERTSWSCAHGVDRWWRDCGCNSGGHPGWNQAWRTPLREAFDWLRDTLAPAYEAKARELLADPWRARDDYIEVILDRSRENVEAFLARHAARPLGAADKTAALKLLELQRHLMLMYTSCGWFFDDLSGIETVQVISYAGRAVQLAEELFGDSVEERFLDLLSRARSNLPEHGDGRQIYGKFVKPMRVDLERVGIHYAVSALFDSYPERAKVFAYTAERERFDTFTAGKARLGVGRARLESDITWEAADLTFAVLHFGDHNLSGAIRRRGEEDFESLLAELSDAFGRGDLPETIRIMDRRFGASSYTLRSLFKDEQRKILKLALASATSEAEALCRQIYEHHAPLMRLLADLNMPAPRAFQAAAEVVINAQLREALESPDVDPERVRALLETARLESISLDSATLEFACRRNLEATAQSLAARPADGAILQRLRVAIEAARRLPFPVNLWKVQNLYYRVLQTAPPRLREAAERGDEAAREWLERFAALGELLSVRVG
jgi:alpha-amylase/alpha-mannosidase (GH57 family)